MVLPHYNHIAMVLLQTLLVFAIGIALGVSMILLADPPSSRRPRFTAAPQQSTSKTAELHPEQRGGLTRLQVAQAQPGFSPQAAPLNLSVLNRGYFDYGKVWLDVYSPLGYNVSSTVRHEHADAANGTVQAECWLFLSITVDCRGLFVQYLQTLQTKPVFPPPESIPPESSKNFTLAQQVVVKPWYIAEAGYEPNAQVPVWTQENVDEGVAQAKAAPPSFGSYGPEVQGMYNALRCAGVTGLQGAVFGSSSPWLESVLLAYGAAHITTIEYRPTVSKASNVTVMTPSSWAQGWLNGTVAETDFAASFSSFEHDGLGRYGDPMNAWGDVAAMQRASCYVKAGGLMFLAVPMCAGDELFFNAHRIYGPVRWPLLASNWQVVGVFSQAWQPTCTSGCDQLWPRVKDACRAKSEGYVHPVVVLRNMRTAPCKAM